jgi:hypothetical protein
MESFERRATRAYLKAHREFSAIIYRHDPLGVAPGAPDDEYDMEASRLLPKLKNARDFNEAQATIEDFFKGAFEWHSAPKETLIRASEDLWEALTRFRASLGP